MSAPPTPDSLVHAREIRERVIEQLQQAQGFLGRVSLQHPGRRAMVERVEWLAEHARFYKDWIYREKVRTRAGYEASIIPALLNVVDKLLDGERLDDSDHATLDAAAEMEESRIAALEAARQKARERAATTVGTSREVNHGDG